MISSVVQVFSPVQCSAVHFLVFRFKPRRPCQFISSHSFSSSVGRSVIPSDSAVQHYRSSSSLDTYITSPSLFYSLRVFLVITSTFRTYWIGLGVGSGCAAFAYLDEAHRFSHLTINVESYYKASIYTIKKLLYFRFCIYNKYI